MIYPLVFETYFYNMAALQKYITTTNIKMDFYNGPSTTTVV